MTEWTDAEIEQIVLAQFKINPEHIRGSYEEYRQRKMEELRQALSVVSRVPPGYWLAPDEPDGEIISRVCRGSTLPGIRLLARGFWNAIRDAIMGKDDG